MSCNITSGFTLDCREGIGGIKTVYITELSNKDSITASNGTITAFTLASGTGFYEYQMLMESGNWQEGLQTSAQNGTMFYEQTLNLKFPTRTAALATSINLLAKNKLMVIVLDNAGTYTLLGETNGMEVEPSTYDSGTAFGDFQGYTLVLKSKQKERANLVDSTLITGLLA